MIAVCPSALKFSQTALTHRERQTRKMTEGIFYANGMEVEFGKHQPALGQKTEEAGIPTCRTQPDFSGSNSSWRRPFLVATVCLGLLYVFMLFGIIGLYVQYVQPKEALENKVLDLENKVLALENYKAVQEIRDTVLENTVKNLTAEFLVSRTKVAALESYMAGQVNRTGTGAVDKVVFAVSMGNRGNYGPFSGFVTMVYQNVFINTGGGYNSETGIFTAPVKGVYFFMYSGHNRNSRNMGLWLMNNGNQVLAIYNHADSVDDNYETGSNSVSLTLEVGDRIYIQLTPDTWVFDDFSKHTTFNGHLLFAL